MFSDLANDLIVGFDNDGFAVVVDHPLTAFGGQLSSQFWRIPQLAKGRDQL